MVLHSLVAYRSDRPRRPAINFQGEGWLEYVPIRVPDTVVVEERLPATAAAVLINRNHTYTDIYLPIDAAQKRVFDTIDGQKSIGELAPNEELRSVARILFERLWEYDHVVFNTMQSAREI